ncbi:MAG: tetratricopeptide repeat protein [Acidobacteria bacterium]|nr:tetratricopeptide repeat protein [Acidobacteriota bacterium]
MTTRNFLFCLGGLVLGFGVGFFLANRLGVGSTDAPTVAASDQVSSINVKGAPPLDPSEDTGQLPPGHPDINGAASGATPASPEGAAAQDADALLEMGNVKYDSGDFTAAADFYTRSLAANPSNADARTDLGNTFFQRNPPDYRRAIEEYRRALEIDPRHELTLQNLASAALNLKDKATARDAVDKLAAINPNNSMLAALRSSLDSLP